MSENMFFPRFIQNLYRRGFKKPIFAVYQIFLLRTVLGQIPEDKDHPVTDVNNISSILLLPVVCNCNLRVWDPYSQSQELSKLTADIKLIPGTRRRSDCKRKPKRTFTWFNKVADRCIMKSLLITVHAFGAIYIPSSCFRDRHLPTKRGRFVSLKSCTLKIPIRILSRKKLPEKTLQLCNSTRGNVYVCRWAMGLIPGDHGLFRWGCATIWPQYTSKFEPWAPGEK